MEMVFPLPKGTRCFYWTHSSLICRIVADNLGYVTVGRIQYIHREIERFRRMLVHRNAILECATTTMQWKHILHATSWFRLSIHVTLMQSLTSIPRDSHSKARHSPPFLSFFVPNDPFTAKPICGEQIHRRMPNRSNHADANQIRCPSKKTNEKESDDKLADKRMRNYASVKRYRERNRVENEELQKQYEKNEERIERLERACQKLTSELEGNGGRQSSSFKHNRGRKEP